MADLKHIVAGNLQRLRRAKSWTQEDLANHAGLSPRYVGQIERGQASMSISVLGRLAETFEVEVAILVTRLG